jgi:hypothetical protein
VGVKNDISIRRKGLNKQKKPAERALKLRMREEKLSSSVSWQGETKQSAVRQMGVKQGVSILYSLLL